MYATFVLLLVTILDLAEKEGKSGRKYEPYDVRVIWSLIMQYPPLTEFG